MLKILINASARINKSVILQRIEGEEVAIMAEKMGDLDIVTSIAEIIKEQNISLKDIKSFEFVDGAGSFTGIKIAAAVANVLEWAVNKTDLKDLKMPKYDTEPNIQKSKS